MYAAAGAALGLYAYYSWEYVYSPNAEQNRAELGAVVQDTIDMLIPPQPPATNNESYPVPQQALPEPGGFALDAEASPNLGDMPATQADFGSTVTNAWIGNNPLGVHTKDGLKRATTDLPGGMKAAKDLFQQYAGRLPSQGSDASYLGPTDEYINGSTEVQFRPNSRTGTPVVEIIDRDKKTYERIHFNP